jgi:hypothetical protein
MPLPRRNHIISAEVAGIKDEARSSLAPDPTIHVGRLARIEWESP